MDPDMYGGGEPGREQVRNYLLAEGFRRSVGNSNAMHLCIRYSAQSERLHRRAIEDFDRIKALRQQNDGSDPPSEPLPDQTNPMCALIAQDHQWVQVPPQEVSVCLCS
jgi:hypothetical protein